MSAHDRHWFLAERSTALAHLLLTATTSLVIEERMQNADGADFVVALNNSPGPATTRFVVQVKGTTSTDNTYWIQNITQLVPVTSLALPVCLFLFNVRTREGSYAWIAEPQIAGGQSSLAVVTTPVVHALNGSALEDIISLVRQWYDSKDLSITFEPAQSAAFDDVQPKQEQRSSNTLDEPFVDSLPFLREFWSSDIDELDDEDILSIREFSANGYAFGDILAHVGGGDSFDYEDAGRTVFSAVIVIDALLALKGALKTAFGRMPTQQELLEAFMDLADNTQASRLREAALSANLKDKAAKLLSRITG